MATKYWLGTAAAIPEVKAYVFAGTWAADDTAWIQINGERLTLTAGTIVTVTQMALDMADMITGAAANQDEARSSLGNTIGEFALLTVTTSAGQVILTGPADGRPIGDVTTGETTTGDGTFAAVGGAPDVAGTGPHHFDNVDNWSSGSVPEDGDVMVFDYRAAGDCLYALTPTSLDAAAITIQGFRYNIGLPAVNTDTPNYPFDEHQSQYLVVTTTTAVLIDSPSAGRIKLDTGSTASAINVLATGASSETGVPPVLIKANHASSTLTVSGGSVGLCYEDGVTGQVSSLTLSGNMSPKVSVGPGVTIGTLAVSAGTCITRSAPTVVTSYAGVTELWGGATTTLNVSGGTVYFCNPAATTHTTVWHAGGTIDCTKDGRARTCTNFYAYRGALKDPSGTITFSTGLCLYCKPSEYSLDLPPVRKYTIGSI